jgi:nitric oxide reductase large subunit
MLKKIITLNKAYLVNWTPKDVCYLLKDKSITAGELIQSNKLNTNKLIRELYLLACRASLSSTENEKAATLTNYAKAITQISSDYENLFGRKSMTQSVTSSKSTNDAKDDSVIINIDRLQARLYYLMTQYSVHPCTHIAAHIVEILTRLCQHPHIELIPAQHYIYSQSLNYWRSRLMSNSSVKNKESLH